jgi:cyclopropane-fatty-acyl-phospholipid synthase
VSAPVLSLAPQPADAARAARAPWSDAPEESESAGLDHWMLEWCERGLVPDWMVRAGIRRLLRARLGALQLHDLEAAACQAERFIASMEQAQIALLPEKANEQHYEVPAEWYALVLGPRRKYSCCLWLPGMATLAEAEQAALEATCSRAGVEDGQRILELGCGWGSLTLWIAQRYPHAHVTAISNSSSQREFIERELAAEGLANVRVVTADINRLALSQQFDRVVSVEMFEHVRNWRLLMARIYDWLLPGGRFFLHTFVHRAVPYAFEVQDPSDWMSRYFFSGGMMPTEELALRLQGRLQLLQRWRWSGEHYQRTAEAWLANLDRQRADALPILRAHHGAASAELWLQRWRMFFMACAELFGFEQGREWWVSHSLFERPR